MVTILSRLELSLSLFFSDIQIPESQGFSLLHSRLLPGLGVLVGHRLDLLQGAAPLHWTKPD